MTNLQKMLKGAHVEWKKLGELGIFYSGLTGKNKSDFLRGNAKFVSYKNVYSNPSVDLNILEVVRILDGENQKTLQYGDIIFTLSSETLEECGLSSVMTEHVGEPIYLNSFCFYLRLKDKSILLPDFSKHLFRSEMIRKQIIKTANGVTRFNVSRQLMKNVLIPIPPIEVQSEIVRILDVFNTLIEELLKKLESELDLRKKQYAYYLEKLLSEEGLKRCAEMLGEEASLCWAKIGEVCNLQRGRVISKIYLGAHKGAYPVYSSQTKNSGEIGAIDTYDFDGEYATWTTDGAYAGTVFYRNGKFSITNIAGLISCKNKDQLLVKFVVYWLQIEAKKHVTYGSGNHKLMIHAMSDVPIPIPPLKVQSYVVDVLDKFSALIAETEGALPAEIAMRKKQYEYYRDALLKFEK